MVRGMDIILTCHRKTYTTESASLQFDTDEDPGQPGATLCIDAVPKAFADEFVLGKRYALRLDPKE